GADRFAGFALNGSIALTLFGLSLAHVLSVTLATVGYRIRTGFVNLMHGLIYALAALCMGYFAGPLGVSVSGALAALLVATPVLWKLNRLAISHPDWELLQ